MLSSFSVAGVFRRGGCEHFSGDSAAIGRDDTALHRPHRTECESGGRQQAQDPCLRGNAGTPPCRNLYCIQSTVILLESTSDYIKIRIQLDRGGELALPKTWVMPAHTAPYGLGLRVSVHAQELKQGAISACSPPTTPSIPGRRKTWAASW